MASTTPSGTCRHGREECDEGVRGQAAGRRAERACVGRKGQPLGAARDRLGDARARRVCLSRAHAQHSTAQHSIAQRSVHSAPWRPGRAWCGPGRGMSRRPGACPRQRSAPAPQVARVRETERKDFVHYSRREESSLPALQEDISFRQQHRLGSALSAPRRPVGWKNLQSAAEAVQPQTAEDSAAAAAAARAWQGAAGARPLPRLLRDQARLTPSSAV